MAGASGLRECMFSACGSRCNRVQLLGFSCTGFCVWVRSSVSVCFAKTCLHRETEKGQRASVFHECERSWQFSTTHNTNAHPQRLPVWSSLCMNKDMFASLNSSEQLGSSCAGKEQWEKQRSATVVKKDSQQAFFYFILGNVKKMCENNCFSSNQRRLKP